MNSEIVRGMEANGWGGYENDNWPVRLAVRKSVDILSEGEDKQTLLAGVSSFGVSGTIACAIISLNRSIETKQIQQLHYQIKQTCSKKWQRILPLSTHSENSMKKFLEKYLKFLKNEKEWNFNEICVAASYLRGKNVKNPPLNVRAVIILPDVDGSSEVLEEEPIIVRKDTLTSINYRLGFWPKIAWTLYEQVSAYKDSLELILNKLGINKQLKEIRNPSIIKLADAFGRFKMLKEFGIIKEEDEIINKNNNLAINLFRELIWAKEENELTKDKIIKCIEEIKKKSNIGEKYATTKQPNKLTPTSSNKLIIGPTQSDLAYSFASIETPSDLQQLIASSFRIGKEINWPKIYQIPTKYLPLLNLINLPKYSFDRQKRFWTLKDDFELNKDNGCHPLLGNCVNRGNDFVKFESLLCEKRMPWLIFNSSKNSSKDCHLVGLLIELLTSIGHLNLKLECFLIQIEEICLKEFLNKKEKQWIITEILNSEKIKIFGEEKIKRKN
uniref:Uncharacterized protein n=1 Tax=Meloidogyne enterolobii TaxID=390850 RepID=A0A6V7V9A8_MELEN|nr:unnamed protein product [Meloidogyne enterolobii]